MLAITLAFGFVFGLVPLIQARRTDLQAALKSEEGRGTTGNKEIAAGRSFLMVSEIALAVVLVIGAGLLIKSFWHLQRVNPGFDPEGVIKAEFQLSPLRYPMDFRMFPNFKEIHQFNAALLARASALPGVVSAAIAGNHPLEAGFTNSWVVVGREAEARDWPEISVRRVSPDYFRTLRIPLVRGRLIANSDDVTSATVVLVNAETIRRFFVQQDPIGQQISLYGARRTIVGVVGDEKIHGLAAPPPIALYLPLAQAPTSGATLIARTSGDAALVASSLREAVREIDPALAVFGLEPLQQTLDQSTSEQRFMMLLVGVFATIALTLAIVGIYGVLGYGVARRKREIGIRMALGAEPRRVTGLVLAQSARLTAIGLGAGVALAILVSQWLTGLLFGISLTDLSTYAGVVILLGAVAMLAAWVPARRAARVDPLVALRYE